MQLEVDRIRDDTLVIALSASAPIQFPGVRAFVSSGGCGFKVVVLVYINSSFAKAAICLCRTLTASTAPETQCGRGIAGQIIEYH